MNKILSIGLVAVILLAAPAVRGEIGTLDPVPAATLLLPYFEVDPNEPFGVNTVFTVRNASAASELVHVTFWSNLSVPILNFDIYLTGFDQQTIDLRALLVQGQLPVTAPDDAVSPRGRLAGPHDDFGGSCDGRLPLSGSLPSLFLNLLNEALTGQPVSFFLGGECAATPTDHLTGYVTIDSVNECSADFANTPGYFLPGGTGIASNRNSLWGDWFLVDPAAGIAHGDALVAIEASATDPRTSTPGSRTFYGRYVGGSAADNREPLTAEWNVPVTPLSGVTGDPAELLVWRSSGLDNDSFSCGSLPAPFPLGEQAAVRVAADGTRQSLGSGRFPVETQRVTLAEEASWLDLDLDVATGGFFDPQSQAHVVALRKAADKLSTGMAAVQASGVVGATDAAPAATLLLPYFEVDLQGSPGPSTVVTVRNASPDPVLGRAVLWTDLSIPTLSFHLYLPGHASTRVDLRAMLTEGAVPSTPAPPLTGCTGFLPQADLGAAALDDLQKAHTGASSPLFGGLCAAHDHADATARGYLTVDRVTGCSSALPGDADYFAEDGTVGLGNDLWGDYEILEPGLDQAHGDLLVHLQASATDPRTATPGLPTFYGRFVGGTAADHREALPGQWGVGLLGGSFAGGAVLRVWRDTGFQQMPFTCGIDPPPFPLATGENLTFDDTGDDEPVAVDAGAFAREAQGPGVSPPLPGGSGWVSLDLRSGEGGVFAPLLQSHVAGVQHGPGSAVSLPGFRVAAPTAPEPTGPRVTAVASDPRAVEQPLDPGEIVVARIGPTDGDLLVNVQVAGSAEAGVDYEESAVTEVLIPDGQPAVRLEVTPVADGLPEPEESVTLSLLPGSGYQVGSPDTAEVMLSDQPEGARGDLPPIPALDLFGLTLTALLLTASGVFLLRHRRMAADP